MNRSIDIPPNLDSRADSHVEAELDRVDSQIGVASVTNGDHSYHDEFVMDLVDHPELPTARGITARQLVAEGLAYSVRILRQNVVKEVGAGGGDCFGESMGQRAASGWGQLNPIGHSGSLPSERISASTSSKVEILPAATSASA